MGFDGTELDTVDTAATDFSAFEENLSILLLHDLIKKLKMKSPTYLNDIQNELESLKKNQTVRSKRDSILNSIYRDFPGEETGVNDILRRPSMLELDQAYKITCNRLNYIFPNVLRKTIFESKLLLFIRGQTHLRPLQTVWIGLMNVDFLLVGACATLKDNKNSLKGLAIEVDGKIHDETHKMAKDLNKVDRLSRLQIGLVSIRNWDLSYAQSLLSGYAKICKLSTRERQRVQRRIQLETISCAASRQEFNALFLFNSTNK